VARKYSTGASKKVEKAMHERKEGTLKSGRSGKTVKSRKQAIAIGLSEARREGKKAPKRRSCSRSIAVRRSNSPVRDAPAEPHRPPRLGTRNHRGDPRFAGKQHLDIDQ
jgi:hypothetical protein